MVRMTNLKWRRSEEGYVESHCKRFSISPIYMGQTTPQGYYLYVDKKRLPHWWNTQKEAKDHARDAYSS